MALEITKEFATEHGLSEEQVTAVLAHGNTWHDTEVSDLKKGWDDKANTDAQGILDGALKLVVDKTGVKREEGEKAGDFFPRAWTEFSKTGQTEIDKLKTDYELKLKEFDGDADTKKALEQAEQKLDEAQKKYADYDDLTGFKEKFETLSGEHLTMKDEVCFGKVRPNFPDTVNEYEGKAKWSAFVDGIKKEWNIELVEGEPMAINKENPHKTTPLVDLLKKDEELSKLMEGRQQGGPGGKQSGKMTTIEGVPFEVPEGMDAKKRSEVIQEYLAGKNIAKHTPEYSKLFGVYNTKILGQQTV